MEATRILSSYPTLKSFLLSIFLFCKGKVLVRKSYLTPFTTIKNDPCKKWYDLHAETYTYQYCSFSQTLFKIFSLKVQGIDKSSDIYLKLGYMPMYLQDFSLTISQGSVLKFSLFLTRKYSCKHAYRSYYPSRYSGIISNLSSAAMSYAVHLQINFPIRTWLKKTKNKTKIFKLKSYKEQCRSLNFLSFIK